jgi:hypothetical protein
MEETAPDRKPGRLFSLYVPATLGALTAALSVWQCDCKLTWPAILMGVPMGSVFVFGIWWIAVMVFFHAYHFVRGLFHHPN